MFTYDESYKWQLSRRAKLAEEMARIDECMKYMEYTALRDKFSNLRARGADRDQGHKNFRSKLMTESKGMCFVTKDSIAPWASHIVPWALCGGARKLSKGRISDLEVRIYDKTDSNDRANPSNGLLLTPVLDHLFDRHEIR